MFESCPADKKGEIEISKLIKDGKDKIYRLLFLLTFTLDKIIALSKKVMNEEIPLDTIIESDGNKTAGSRQTEIKNF